MFLQIRKEVPSRDQWHDQVSESHVSFIRFDKIVYSTDVGVHHRLDDANFGSDIGVITDRFTRRLEFALIRVSCQVHSSKGSGTEGEVVDDPR